MKARASTKGSNSRYIVTVAPQSRSQWRRHPTYDSKNVDYKVSENVSSQNIDVSSQNVDLIRCSETMKISGALTSQPVSSTSVTAVCSFLEFGVLISRKLVPTLSDSRPSSFKSALKTHFLASEQTAV